MWHFFWEWHFIWVFTVFLIQVKGYFGKQCRSWWNALYVAFHLSLHCISSGSSLFARQTLKTQMKCHIKCISSGSALMPKYLYPEWKGLNKHVQLLFKGLEVWSTLSSTFQCIQAVKPRETVHLCRFNLSQLCHLHKKYQNLMCWQTFAFLDFNHGFKCCSRCPEEMSWGISIMF